MKTTRRTEVYFIVLLVVFVGLATISYDKSTRRQLYEIKPSAELDMDPTFIDGDGVCVNALPYGKMHDLRPEEVAKYDVTHIYRAGGWAESFDHEAPDHVVLPPLLMYTLHSCHFFLLKAKFSE